MTEEENSAVASSVAAPPVVSHSRKELSFLKPAIISGDCNKRELKKFIDDTRTWLNKTLTQSEREEPGMILAVIKSVLDSDWADILERTPDIKNKSYDEITEVMLGAFLERHPLVVQRINAMRIVKEKDESISGCMRKILDAYLSADLGNAPLETLVLLHLLILLPSDTLSEKIKSWLVEKMRLQPNIKSLEEVSAYIQSQENDFIARKHTVADKKIMLVKDEEKDKDVKCRICSKLHPR